MSDRLESFQYSGSGERLDKYLVACLPEFSRARLQGLIANGLVEVDGQTAKKGGQELAGGEHISVRIPPARPVDLLAEDIPLVVRAAAHVSGIPETWKFRFRRLVFASRLREKSRPMTLPSLLLG